VTARGKARKKALDVLYEADVRGIAASDVLDAKADAADSAMNPYTAELVWGVVEHADRIDDLLASYSQGWTLERMPAVDRNLLRIGTYELLWCDDIPPAVAISEAVGLAKALSTDESPTFVNGLLARILEVKPKLALD
jgi:N utilization substance protein B